MNPIEIGQRIKLLRGNMSQAEFANKLGITKSSLAMYERGERIPRDEVKIRISKRCGVSIESLFFTRIEH